MLNAVLSATYQDQDTTTMGV